LIVVFGGEGRRKKDMNVSSVFFSTSHIMFPKKKLSWMFLVVGLMLEGSGAFLPLRRNHQLAIRGVVHCIYSQSQILPPATFLREANKEDGAEKPKELTPDMVAEMVEVTFVNACLQLARG
jgi:hypothetical protein